jgi:hypothetical protein
VWTEFPPHVLREYAVLADGRRAALLGPHGDVAWLCAPTWHSPAVFAALIGGEGVYAITPDEPSVWGGYYEPGSLIWHSRWVTTDTVLECHEALARPSDPHRVVLLRRICAPEDDARVRVLLDPRAGYGARPLTGHRRDGDGTWTASTGQLAVRFTGAPQATVDDRGRLVTDLVVPAGGVHDLVLELGDGPLPDLPDPERLWHRTRASWAADVPDLADTVAPRDARHAYAVLRGLTCPDGGTVAAATLGLPERAEAGRNYDYRYVWLRDQAYAGMAAGVARPYPLLDEAVSVTVARVLEHGDQLAPAYRVDGGDLPRQTGLGLTGYPGGADVVGNWVRGQFQLDTVGELLLLLATAARHDHLDADGRKAGQLLVDLIAGRWQAPDAGIWELHDAWWTQSRLACVAGLRTAATVPAAAAAGFGRADRLHALADAILAETDRRCVRPDGAWRRSPDHRGTDASLLLPPVRGALPGTDPRTVATLGAVRRELTQDGYVYRFAPEPTVGDPPDGVSPPDPDRLGDAEGAFLLCGFTMALAQWQQGDRIAAFRHYERTRAACGPPGLLAEEFDVQQRQLRGNLPQAFVHALLLETAQRLAG